MQRVQGAGPLSTELPRTVTDTPEGASSPRSGPLPTGPLQGLDPEDVCSCLHVSSSAPGSGFYHDSLSVFRSHTPRALLCPPCLRTSIKIRLSPGHGCLKAHPVCSCIPELDSGPSSSSSLSKRWSLLVISVKYLHCRFLPGNPNPNFPLPNYQQKFAFKEDCHKDTHLFTVPVFLRPQTRRWSNPDH